MEQWSDHLLKTTNTLIQQVKNIGNYYQIVEEIITPIKLPSKDLLWITMKHLLTETDVQPLILNYLTSGQLHTIKTVFPLINTLDDFNYLVNHLPFYPRVMDLLCNVTQSLLPPQLTNQFMSPVIQSWIFGHCHWLSSYQLRSQCGPIRVQLLSDRQQDPTSILRSIVKIVTMVCTVYHVTKHFPPLHIIYVMTPFSKKLHSFVTNPLINRVLIRELKKDTNLIYNYERFTNPLTNLSVNGGVTTIDGAQSYIAIWRTEEFEKVLIHELIHFYDLEKGFAFKLPPLNISNNYPTHPKELFTELQTWYLYVVYRGKDLDLQRSLDLQRKHSIDNVTRILHHYGNTSIAKDMNPHHMINVGSSVVYYYVCKALLLSAMDQVIEAILIPSTTNQYERLNNNLYVEKKLAQLLYSFRLGPNPIDDALTMMK